MRLRLTFSALILVPYVLLSAQVSLTGKVTFHDGTTPVTGVTIAVPTGVEQKETTTDVVGNYSMSIAEGTYDELRVRTMGTDIEGVPNMMEYQAESPLVVSGNTIVDVSLPYMPQISGTVKDADGNLLPNAKVEVITFENDMTNLPYDESVVASDGTYKVWLDTGGVKVTVRPPEGSNLPNYVFTFTHTKDTVLNIAFPSLLTLSGTVLSHKGDTVKGITVAMVKEGNQSETTTNSEGKYSFQISSGTIDELRVRNMGQDIEYVPNMLEYTHKSSFPITENLVEDITLPKIHKISGILYSSDSLPLVGATISSAAWDGSMNQLPSDESTTDANGSYALWIADGQTQLIVKPQEGSGLADEEFIASFTSDSTFNYYLSASSTLKGRVLYYDSLPVSGITVALSNGQGQWETTTGIDGSFTISVEPGLYKDFRIRSMGSNIDSVPNMLEYTVDSAGIDLNNSVEKDFVLPRFYRLSGAISNTSNEVVSGITIRSNFWKDNMGGLPSDEFTSLSDGTYELFLSQGVHQVVLTSDGSDFSTITFTIQMDSNLVKDIVLTNQAKGIGRVQPSVIGQGKSGKIQLTGVNTMFTKGVTALELGEGITVTDITVLSDISLSAIVEITSEAPTGSRSVKVIGTEETYVGSELLTITAPVKENALLDSDSRLKQTIVINDGTGTEIVIDSGTLVIFPNGVDPEIVFEAPLIINDTINPDSATFLQIQREFKPSGVTFDPPARITYHYQDQDIEGVDEDSLKAYKYDNEKDSVIGEYEITERDTANNSITQKAETFSLFRLAVPNNVSSVIKGNIIQQELSVTTLNNQKNMQLRFNIPAQEEGGKLHISLYTINGREVYRYGLKEAKRGFFTETIPQSLASGVYLLEFKVGRKIVSKSVIVR